MSSRNGGRTFLQLVALVALVARRDYLRTVRRRGFVFGTALLPAGLAAFVLLSGTLGGAGIGPGAPPVGGPPRRVEVVVVDDSALRLQPGPATPDVRVVPRDEAIAELGAGRLEEFYVVPAAYPAEPAIERIVGEVSGGGAIQALERRSLQEARLATLLRLALLEDAGVAPQTAVRIVSPLGIRERTVAGAPSVPGFDLAAFFVPYAFTLLFVMSIFITSGYLLQSVTEEKENRVVEIVLSSVPALPLMAGKVLGLGGAGLTQVAVWIGTAIVALPLLGERASLVEALASSLDPLTVVLAVVYFALGYLGYGAIFSAIGALAPGTREAQQYAGFLGFFAVVPLIFTGVFLTDPGSPVVVALALIPLTAPVAMLELLPISTQPPWPLIVASLLSLSAFAVVATVASARVFRATLLLYGVRPSVRRIVSAILARG